MKQVRNIIVILFSLLLSESSFSAELTREQKRAEALAFLNQFPILRIVAPGSDGHGAMGMMVTVLDGLDALGYVGNIELLIPTEEHYTLLQNLFPMLKGKIFNRGTLPGYSNVQMIAGWDSRFPVLKRDFAIYPARDDWGIRDMHVNATYNLRMKPSYWRDLTGLTKEDQWISQFGGDANRMGIESKPISRTEVRQLLDQLIPDNSEREILENILNHKNLFHRAVLYGLHLKSGHLKLARYVQALLSSNLDKKTVLTVLSPLTLGQWRIVLEEIKKTGKLEDVHVLEKGESLEEALKSSARVVIVKSGYVPRKILLSLLRESDLLNTAEGTGVSQDARMLGVPYLPLDHSYLNYIKAFEDYFYEVGEQKFSETLLSAAEVFFQFDKPVDQAPLVRIFQELAGSHGKVRQKFWKAGAKAREHNMLVEMLLMAKSAINSYASPEVGCKDHLRGLVSSGKQKPSLFEEGFSPN